MFKFNIFHSRVLQATNYSMDLEKWKVWEKTNPFVLQLIILTPYLPPPYKREKFFSTQLFWALT